jgi:hypothetical protein
MKRFLNLCLSAACVFSVTSCTTYYVSRVSSTNASKNQQSGEFNIENDSIKVTYSFASLQAPVKVTVRNKLKVPLYVDWSKSALIFNEEATSYVPDETSFTANLHSRDRRDSTITKTNNGYIRGKISTPTTSSFVPPNAKVETKTIFLNSPAFEPLPNRYLVNQEELPGFRRLIRVNSADFNRSNSPIVFRSYLTFHTSPNAEEKSFALDTEFYVSKSFKTSKPPSQLLDYNSSFSDVFYNISSILVPKTDPNISVISISPNTPPR